MATSREWVQLVKESSYGTKMTSPTAGTDSIYLVLPESNSFTALAIPDTVETPYGGGFDVVAEAVADSHTVAGQLQTFVYPAQAAFLMAWALTRIDGAQTSPWTTTEPVGDLASVTAYHGIPRPDGSVKREKYVGGKVATLQLECSRQDPRLKATLGLVFQKQVGHSTGGSDPDATEAPAPSESSYPTGPYLFSHTAGNLKLATTAVASYETLSINVQNTLDPKKYESIWLASCPCHGRRATVSAKVKLKASPTLSADLQALTARALEVTWNNGTNTLKIDFYGKNRVSALPYDLPLGREFLQDVTWSNQWDRSNTGDLVVTTT